MESNLVISAKENQESSKKGLSLIFLIWPFLAGIIAMRNFGIKNSRRILLFVFTYFGYVINFGRESMDGATHRNTFIAYSKIDTDTFFKLLNLIFLRQSEKGELDFYLVITNFLVSRFTDSYQVLYMLHGFVFAFFMLKVMEMVFDEFGGMLDNNAKFLFVLLWFILPINNVHAIRFPIATWIYVYGAYQYIRTENRKWFWYCGLACLVHFSFLFATLILAAYSLLGNRNLAYFSLLLVSFIFPSLLLSFLSGFDSKELGEGVAHKVNAYSNEDYIKSRNDDIASRNWYSRLRIPMLQYSLYYAVFKSGFLDRFSLLKDRTQQNLFSFLILFLAMVQFGFAVDSLGRRFILVWFIFALIFLVRCCCLNPIKSYRIIAFVVAFPALVWIIVQIRVSLDTTTWMFYLGNPITSFFIKLDTILK